MTEGLGPWKRYRALRTAMIDDPPGLAVAGELDEHSYGALVDELGLAARGRDEVRIDLSAVEYCDLAGLRAIVLLTEGGRRVVLQGVSTQLQTILGIVGWDGIPGLVVLQDK
jgi:anti-anti-sigma regulatory factor